MVESQVQASSALKDALDEQEPIQSDQAIEEKLYDENGQPKNALYESLAKKKANSVSQVEIEVKYSSLAQNHCVFADTTSQTLYNDCIFFSIITPMCQRDSRKKELSTSKVTARSTEATPY